MVLIFISLMINDVEHCCRCLFALCALSLVKCLFKSFAHFGGVICLITELEGFIFYSRYQCFLDIFLANISSSPWLLFHSLKCLLKIRSI